MNRRNFLGAVIAAGGVTPALSRQALATDHGGSATPSVQTHRMQVASSLHMCVFDTFGTVVDWRGSVIAEVEQLAREKGWDLDAVAFAQAWRANYGPSRNRVRSGELPWTKLDDLHRMTLDDLLIRFQIEGLTEEEKVHLNKVWHRLHPWPDAPGGLARLKTRYVLSPLSNGNVALLTEMAKFGGLPWDCVLGSDVARHYKPDREMYLMPGEFFDIPPSAVMMVRSAHQRSGRSEELRPADRLRSSSTRAGPGRTAVGPARGRSVRFHRDRLQRSGVAVGYLVATGIGDPFSELRARVPTGR